MSIDEWKELFIKNIRIQLVRNRMTREDLAYAIGLNRHSIGRYINGERVPNGYIIYQMAKAFNCSIDDIAYPRSYEHEHSSDFDEFDDFDVYGDEF